MDQCMGYDPEKAIMLEDEDKKVRGRQQASLNAVEYIDLSDNKHYKSCAYGPPFIRYEDHNISTSQTRTNGKIGKIEMKAIIHDRGSTSYDRARYQQLNREDSHQDVPMNAMQNLADVEARKDTTNRPGMRNSIQQLQTTITDNGADVELDALSRVCPRGPTKHAKANATNPTVDCPILPRKRPHMCVAVDLRESDLSPEIEAAKSPRPRLTSLRPFHREQAHNGIANEGPTTNADTAGFPPPRAERNVQARLSNAPKMGFAALETLERPRPAPFGTLKIGTSSHPEEEDQLFFSDCNDQGQGKEKLRFQDYNVRGQKSYAIQRENIGERGSLWARQITPQTQKFSGEDHLTTKSANRKELSRLAREFVPTEVCGVFSESRVPAGCSPAQHIPSPAGLKRRRNMICIICGSKFEVKQYVRNHFPKCVQKNGNPNRHSWFDHPTIRNNNGPQSRRLDDGFGPFSKKADDASAKDSSSSLPGLEADSATTVEHRTTGGKGISDATIASWLAAQSENADIEEEDDHNAETEMETLESAWQYHVTRQEIRTADLGLEDPIERKYAPYCTLEEANAKAREEIQIRDVSPPPGPHPRGWNLQFRKDENGMDSHTVEVQGTTITTTVTRSKSSSSNTTLFFSPTAQAFPIKSTNVKTPSTHSPRRSHQTPYACFRIHNSSDHLYHPLHFHPPYHVGH